MCGIAGKVSLGPISPGLIEAMCEQQVHRGPDSRGIHKADGVALGIQRLRVIDLETGDQPVYNEDRSVAVVLNGEIYNYRELRHDLQRRGHTLATNGDTEVIAHLYEERGPDLVHELHGMFAFAVWDERRRRLLLARDRVGKKPLFYAEGDGWLSFASELRALIVDSEVPREIDASSIDCYLAYGYIPTPWSIWRDVHKVMPAHTLVWERGQVETRRYWSLNYSEKRTEDPRELEEELRCRVGAAVRRRMIADVPLGAFLSGGVDSSIIVAEMAAASAEPVRTFSIGFEEEAYDELPQARRIADRFSTDHREFVVKPDAIEIIPKLVRHYGEPYADSSAIPSFYLAELTRQHVTVALNGDGGDENFAGYLRHAVNQLISPIDRLPKPVRGGVAAVGRVLPAGSDRRGGLAYARRLMESLREDPVERYTWHVSVFNQLERSRLLDPEFHRSVDESRAPAAIRSPWNASQVGNRLDTVLAVDVRSYLPDDLLVKIDIATMAHSLEARSPFLDHEVMEFAASLPPSLKARMGQRKRILRRAYGDRVPKENLTGPKRGFAVPLGSWFRHQLRDYTRETLLSADARTRSYLAEDVVRSTLDSHDRGRADHSAKIWTLLMLEEWYRDTLPGETSRSRFATRAGGVGLTTPLGSRVDGRVAELASRVSVIVPTHNRAGLVGHAIRSVLEQTIPPGEVIVVDDFSDDDTPEVLDRFGDAIRVIRTGENIERGAARNLGAREAKGEFLAFLDSDDEWERDKLEVQLSRSGEGRPSVTAIKYIDELGTPTGQTYLPPPDESGIRILDRNQYLGSPSSLLVPRKAWESVGGFAEDRHLQGSEDWLFLASLSAEGWPIFVVPQSVVRYRIHPGQSTAPATNLARSMWAACEWLDRRGFGEDGSARARRNYAATAVAAAFAHERNWREAGRWASRALGSGTPSARATSIWRISRSAVGGIARGR